MTDTRWISAGAAHQFLSDCFVGSVIAKSEIADRLRRGRLTARARELFRIDGERWCWNPPEKVGLIASAWLDPAIWRTGRRWTDDQRRWRMCFSQMLLTTRLKPERRLILHGVRFLRAQIESIAAHPPSQRSLARQAAKDRFFAIHTAVFEVLCDAKRCGPRDVRFETPQALIHYVRTLFGFDPRTGDYRFSVATVDEFVTSFLATSEISRPLGAKASDDQKFRRQVATIEEDNYWMMRQYRTFKWD